MPEVIGKDVFGEDLIKLLPGEYFYCNTCKMHVPSEDAEECVCFECGNPLEIKKTPLKERILNEMAVTKKEYPLADYETYKLSKDFLIGLSEEESLELNKKGFVSIDQKYEGYGTPIKLLDVTDYAVAYCNYCKEQQPVLFTGHIGNYGTNINQAILVWCDECKGLLFTLDHISNGKKMGGKS
jgi:hypothetical protein